MRRTWWTLWTAAALAGCATDGGAPEPLAGTIVIPPPPAGTSAIAALPRVHMANSFAVAEHCGDLYAQYRHLQRQDSISVVLAVFVATDHRVKATYVLEPGPVPTLDLVAQRCITESARIEPAGVAPDAAGSWQYMKWTWRQR
jgi:hypothetical protein